MDTVQKTPSSMIHHPAVKLVISVAVLIIVVVLVVWLYKKYTPTENTNPRELTPAQKEEIIQRLNEQAASMPKMDPKQQQAIISELNAQAKQQVIQNPLTDAQKQEILNNLQQIR